MSAPTLPMPDGGGPRWYGLYPAVVRDLVDPERRGRIRVSFPMFGSTEVSAWATLLAPCADDGHGFEVLPEVDSQVVVGFEAGDPARPYIVGACWNGQRALPEPAAPTNHLRTWRSRSGSQLQFDDTPGAAKVTLAMDSGHKLVLDDAAQEVLVEHANGCSLKINVAGQVQIMANATVEITASSVNVHAPTVNCDGIVQCTTLIASAGVISPSYTPGAGNVW